MTVTRKDTMSSPSRLVARTWYSPRSTRRASEILSPEERSVLVTSKRPPKGIGSPSWYHVARGRGRPATDTFKRITSSFSNIRPSSYWRGIRTRGGAGNRTASCHVGEINVHTQHTDLSLPNLWKLSPLHTFLYRRMRGRLKITKKVIVTVLN